jgi:hypothetical protein
MDGGMDRPRPSAHVLRVRHVCDIGIGYHLSEKPPLVNPTRLETFAPTALVRGNCAGSIWLKQYLSRPPEPVGDT